MKIVYKGKEPKSLAEYRVENPDASWETFRNEARDSLRDVQGTLRENQRGLCAYCENIMRTFDGVGNDDFRVEHFHPKKRPPHPPPNWDLKWTNLLGVCSGGNDRHVGNSNMLFSSPDNSCDVPKADNNLDGVILNPLFDIPHFPPIFIYDELGSMKVDQKNCPEHLREKAENSINILNLSPEIKDTNRPPRLIRFRREILEKLNSQLEEIIQSGMDDSSAADYLAKIYFTENSDDWPAFFSCIRWYLGPAAEKRLVQINYRSNF